MNDDTSKKCSMFGAFNLKDNTDLTSFKEAFDAFCEHLKTKGYVHSWRLWERVYHEGYDTNYPAARIVLEMCFHDREAALENWAYIEGHTAPIRTLHAQVTGQVKETHFVLCEEVI